jgi:zinc transporter ZupT
MSTADGWTPLLLSTIAGMSTCLGAAIVFFQPKQRRADGTTSRRVGPGLQAFSLALAGAVMVTVSVISIGPECLMDPTYEMRLEIAQENARADRTNSTSATLPHADIDLSNVHVGDKWLMPWSYYFFHRLINFGMGCGLYMAIRYLFPEPDQVETELLAKIYTKAGTSDDAINDNDDASFVSTEELEEGESASSGSSLRRRDSTTNNEQPGEMERLLEKVGGNNDSGDNDDAATRNTAGTIESLDKTIDLYGGSLLNKIKKSGGQKYRDRRALVRRKVVSEGAAKRLLPQDSWQSWASGEDLDDKDAKRAWRVAMLLFVSLAAHNFPEGLAVSAAALETDKLGITVTIGIAIHNVPEGEECACNLNLSSLCLFAVLLWYLTI